MPYAQLQWEEQASSHAVREVSSHDPSQCRWQPYMRYVHVPSVERFKTALRYMGCDNRAGCSSPALDGTAALLRVVYQERLEALLRDTFGCDVLAWNADPCLGGCSVRATAVRGQTSLEVELAMHDRALALGSLAFVEGHLHTLHASSSSSSSSSSSHSPPMAQRLVWSLAVTATTYTPLSAVAVLEFDEKPMLKALAQACVGVFSDALTAMQNHIDAAVRAATAAATAAAVATATAAVALETNRNRMRRARTPSCQDIPTQVDGAPPQEALQQVPHPQLAPSLPPLPPLLPLCRLFRHGGHHARRRHSHAAHPPSHAKARARALQKQQQQQQQQRRRRPGSLLRMLDTATGLVAGTVAQH